MIIIERILLRVMLALADELNQTALDDGRDYQQRKDYIKNYLQGSYKIF